MDEVRQPLELRQRVSTTRCAGGSIGFVATMGYLHDGHLALVRQARSENDLVVMSSYVNPTQFGPHEDLSRYPRDTDRDRLLAAGAGVDLLFLPDDETMYPGGPSAQQVWVDPGSLALHFEGAARPGHFRAVATVVAKLFHLVQPDRAYFGQKDGQQAAIVARLIVDLGWPIELRILPTVREPSGLALSSRNVFLDERQRQEAAALSTALAAARDCMFEGERDPHTLEGLVREHLAVRAPGGRVDYVAIADLDTMTPLTAEIKRDAIIALAVFFGSTRLIDNGVIRFHDGRPRWS